MKIFTNPVDSYVNTFGGESEHWSDYGIEFGQNIVIDTITPEQMISLGCQIINHLIVNGHRFEIIKIGEQDQIEKIIVK